MKVFICVIIILSLLIFAFTANYFYLKNESNLLIKSFDKIEKYAFEKDDENLKKAYNELEDIWEKSKNILFIFSNHKDLDSIYESILKIKVRIFEKDYFGIIEESEIAKRIVKGAPGKEIPNLENIF